MRSREIAPLKPPDVDLDSHRYNNNNHHHHYEPALNRKLTNHKFFSILFC